MVDSKSTKETPVPEPPKFNLNDLPEPPKLDMPQMKEAPSFGNLDKEVSVTTTAVTTTEKTTEKTIPNFEINSINTPEAKSILKEPELLKDLPPPPLQEKKSGFFSKLFAKKQKEPKAMPKELSSSLVEEKIELAPVSDDQFAPPDLKSNLDNTTSLGAMPELPPAAPSIQLGNTDSLMPVAPVQSELAPAIDNHLTSETIVTEKTVTETTVTTEEPKSLDNVLNEKETEMLQEGEDYIKKITPLLDVKGVGPARAKKLKRAGIKSAEELATDDHKRVAKKLKIPESHAREIISYAKKITKIKDRLKQSKVKENKGISAVIKQLEEEKKDIEIMQKKDKITEDKLIEIEGHKELIDVLQALEKKRKELVEQEEKLAQKEISMSEHDDTYRRDMEHIENLKRRLDHDVRERTQYLINLEKEYFQKAQSLAKKQSEVEVREKALAENEEYLKKREADIKMKLNDLEDRSISVETKEKKYGKIMNDLEKQDLALKEKEDDLLKREADYMKKLDTLDDHEKSILKNLEEKRKSLEAKEKELSMRENRLHTTQRNVDKKSVEVEYAKNIIESEKGKLVDDEFEQYLHEQLGLLKTSGINIDDINLTKNVTVGSGGDKGGSIYQLIDTCRDLLKNNRVTEAKVFYNQVRDKYYGSNYMGQKEKETVHNLIRSLYDEINLADIGSNR